MAKAKLNVLFDLVIILGVLQEPAEFYEFSARLLARAETGKIQGWLAAHSVTTLSYLIAKDKSPEQARLSITRNRKDFQPAPMTVIQPVELLAIL